MKTVGLISSRRVFEEVRGIDSSEQRTVEAPDQVVADEGQRNNGKERCINKVREDVLVHKGAEGYHTIPNHSADSSYKSCKQSAVDECVVEFCWRCFGHDTCINSLQDNSSHEDSREERNVTQPAFAPIVRNFIFLVQDVGNRLAANRNLDSVCPIHISVNFVGAGGHCLRSDAHHVKDEPFVVQDCKQTDNDKRDRQLL